MAVGQRWAAVGRPAPDLAAHASPLLPALPTLLPSHPSPPTRFVFIIFSLVLAAGWAAILAALRLATCGERAAAAAAALS